MPGIAVERMYKARQLLAVDANTSIFVLGEKPESWVVMEEPEIADYESWTNKGGRVVIAFLPATGYAARKPRNEPKRPIEPRWNIRFTYEVLDDESVGLRFAPGPEWHKLDEDGDVIERRLGSGTVVLVARSVFLSNEGLRDDRESSLITAIVGGTHRIVFDENHFGVAETGSISKLMRKYRLEGALAVLAIVAGLFLWRSASSLLPSRAPSSDAPSDGRDSMDGLAALLRRGIKDKDVLDVCFEEWKKTSPQPARVERVKQEIADRKDIVGAYRKAAHAAWEKK